jgi:hypothetical protein
MSKTAGHRLANPHGGRIVAYQLCQFSAHSVSMPTCGVVLLRRLRAVGDQSFGLETDQGRQRGGEEVRHPMGKEELRRNGSTSPEPPFCMISSHRDSDGLPSCPSPSERERLRQTKATMRSNRVAMAEILPVCPFRRSCCSGGAPPGFSSPVVENSARSH